VAEEAEAETWEMKSFVLRVGGGRGFVVNCRRPLGSIERLVVTAAHCLPRKLPPPHPGRYLEEATYHRLLGPIGGKCTVWAECRFVDPIADIAVLGQPDSQELADEAEAYDALVGLCRLLRRPSKALRYRR
jgi:hypothetical protein